MILTPIAGPNGTKIHIRSDKDSGGSGRQFAVYDPATNAIEIKQNGETCNISLEELLEQARQLGAVRVSVSSDSRDSSLDRQHTDG